MFIDISLSMDKDTDIYPGDPHFEIKKVFTVKNNGFEVSSVSFGSHFSTHIDSPRHFFENGKDIASLPVDIFCGTAAVFDCGDNEFIDESFIKKRITGKFDMLLFKTKNKRCSLTVSGAKSIADCKIKLCGTQNDDIEPVYAPEFPSHHILLSKNIPILENLCLENVDEGIYRLYCFPLRISDCDASPVRAVLETL